MAIKVKHEGSASPAAYAAANGSRGKRAMQEAANMSATMQQAESASLRQLNGATASTAPVGRASIQQAHAQFTSAPTPSAPYGFGDGIRARGVTPTQTIRTSDGSGQGENRAAPRTTFIGLTESPQEQLAKRQAAKALQDDINNQVVESNERFGKHSPDAVWDPANGGAWVRPYRPGEKEALAQEQMNAVNSQDWEYRYTRQQQMEQEKLRNAYSDIMSDPTLSADEKKYMGDQVAKQFYGIQKMPYEKDREDEATKYQREKDQRDYEAKLAEAQAKRDDLEEKRYQDAVFKLSAGHSVSEPVLDEKGEAFGYEKVQKPYTDDEKNQILKELFPNRSVEVERKTEPPPPQENPEPAPEAPAAADSSAASSDDWKDSGLFN